MSDQRRKRQPVNHSHVGGVNGRGRDDTENKAGLTKAHPSALKRRSTDNIRKIVEEEGRTARNLVTFNVPLEVNVSPDTVNNNNSTSQSSGTVKPLKSRSSSNQTQGYNNKDQSCSPRHRSQSGSARGADESTRKSPQLVRKERRGPAQPSAEQPSTDEPSGSSRASPQLNNVRDMRARYWAFLFENLERAVSEIYNTCEADESVVECKEVLMMLDCCTRDFKSLIERLDVMKTYDKVTEEGHRPQSLAYELRKTSPGKPLLAGRSIEPSVGVARSLTFSSEAPPPATVRPLSAATSTSGKIATGSSGRNSGGSGNTVVKSSGVKRTESQQTGNRNSAGSSWADRVKGVRHANTPREGQSMSGSATKHTARNSSNMNLEGGQRTEKSEEQIVLRNEEAEDSDGWETVQRSQRPRSGGQGSRSGQGTRSGQGSSRSSRSSRSRGSTTSLNLSREDVRVRETEREKSRSAVSVCSEELSGALNLNTAQSMGSLEQRSSNETTTESNGQLSLDVSDRTSNGIGGEVITNSESDNIIESTNGERRELVTEQQDNSASEEQHSNTEIQQSDNIATNQTSDNSIDQQNNRDNREGLVEGSSASTTDREAFTDKSSEVTTGQVKVEGVGEIGEGGATVESITLDKREEIKYDDDDVSDDDDDDDTYDMEMANALRTVMSEEECLEELLDLEQQAALESVTAVEQSYLLEIARNQSQQELTPTDNLSPNHNEPASDLPTNESAGDMCSTNEETEEIDWETVRRRYDDEAELRKQSKWGDIMEEMETRTPGRVVLVHEKLSSPSRKKTALETWKHQEERQAKAQEQRERMLQDKSEQLRLLTRKVEEVQLWKAELMQQRKQAMERKLRSAEEKRQLLLQIKVNKAHQEETKANEIAFINTLEAQNKKHDIMSKHLESEARLQDLQEERLRKHEEKAAKEAAAEERRKALEADRVSRLMEMQERRKQRESEFEQRQQEREKERLEAARAKERDREERLQALSKQQQQHIEDLQKKIQHKQDESLRRLLHKEKLEAIQEKAICMTILRHSTEDHNDTPKLVPYERKKFCTICNVIIPSEVYLLSHLRGKKHQQALLDSGSGRELSKQDIEAFNLSHITDAPLDKTDDTQRSESVSQERNKAMKKRLKKLRARMSARGVEYEASVRVTHQQQQQQGCDSLNKVKLLKVMKDLQKYSTVQAGSTGPWPQSKVSALDKSLGEIKRLLDRLGTGDQTVMRVYGGLTCVCKFLDVVRGSVTDSNASCTQPAVIPNKTVVLACNVLLAVCGRSLENCNYLLYSNHITTIIDLLLHHLQLLIKENVGGVALSSSSSGASMFKLPHSPTATALTFTLSHVLNVLASHSSKQQPIKTADINSTNGKTVCDSNGNQGPIKESKPSGPANGNVGESKQNDNSANEKIDNDNQGGEAKNSEPIDGKDKNNEPMKGEAKNSHPIGEEDSRMSRLSDVIGYMVSVGVLDVLSEYLDNVRSPVDNDSNGAEFIHSALSLVSALIRLTSNKHRAFLSDDSSVEVKDTVDDPTQLLATLRSTQLLGVVSLLYGMLLHSDAPSRGGSSPPPPLPPHTMAVANMAFLMLNHIAELDIHLLQSVLGEEGISLEYRHIVSYLLWYSSQRLDTSQQLLHELILSIGYFTVLNRDNQVIIQSGQAPTVLQQLCSLPFQYFSDARLTHILFPTLISCCYLVHRNREILEQELSAVLLANYLEKKLLELQKRKEEEGSGGLMRSDSCSSTLSSASHNADDRKGRGAAAVRKNKAASKTERDDWTGRTSLMSRFPAQTWPLALQFFNSSPHSSIGSTSNSSITDLSSVGSAVNHLR